MPTCEESRWLELIRLRPASARQVVNSPESRDLAWLESRSYDFRVSTVDEIKKAAGALSVNEREELLNWLMDVDDDWDRQMAKDAAAGKLDFLIEEARTAKNVCIAK